MKLLSHCNMVLGALNSSSWIVVNKISYSIRIRVKAWMTQTGNAGRTWGRWNVLVLHPFCLPIIYYSLNNICIVHVTYTVSFRMMSLDFPLLGKNKWFNFRLHFVIQNSLYFLWGKLLNLLEGGGSESISKIAISLH